MSVEEETQPYVIQSDFDSPRKDIIIINSTQLSNKQKNSKVETPSACLEIIKSMCTCFGLFIGIGTLLGIIGGCFTWLILSIIALANNSNDDIQDICPNSNLWVCLLILVVISLTGSLGVSNSGDNKPGAAVVAMLFNMALSIWIGLELHKQCAVDNLSEMNIYMYLYAWFWFAVSVFGILIIAFIGVCCVAGGLSGLMGERKEKTLSGGSPSTQVTDVKPLLSGENNV
jgi:hypothetical protein